MDDIELHPYDPNWPGAFDREARVLAAALSGEMLGDMHHVGSTAVPGLAAKPIIDVLMTVPDLEAARAAFPAKLDEIGYDFWAGNPDRTRSFFVKGMPPRGRARTHHLHVVQQESAVVARHIGFRDYLRAHPDEAAAYEALKRQLAAAYRHDREAYTEAKTGFVDRVLGLIEG